MKVYQSEHHCARHRATKSHLSVCVRVSATANSFLVETKALTLTKTAKEKFISLLEEFANGVLAKAEGASIMEGRPTVISDEILHAFRMGCEGSVKLKGLTNDEWGEWGAHEEHEE